MAEDVRGRASAEELQARLDRTQAKLVRMRRTLRETRAELEQLRSFTLDVHPTLELPPRVGATIDAVRAEARTYLTVEQLTALASCVHETETSGREGIIIEAGTALGGSAIVMASAKAAGREMRVYDVFGQIPEPSERDGDDVHARYQDIRHGRATGLAGDLYYGYREDLEGEVTASFAGHGLPVEANNVHLVKGLFQDTLVVDQPVALAHVDGDWYESTKTCLVRIGPMLVPGGRIIIDDYFNWSGCRAAVDECFAGRPQFRIEKRAKVHVVRLPG